MGDEEEDVREVGGGLELAYEVERTWTGNDKDEGEVWGGRR